ncbi:hypothetical protein RI129_001226 [Pyrocoelia pectoralis]|uniref:O-acyltransferase WSD1 C-terminal domain-containing protein n=1 Tax=Pyrocoelia pectoralis TaxID=417401 RepID=A0AAN7ZPJ9_9COLE
MTGFTYNWYTALQIWVFLSVLYTLRAAQCSYRSQKFLTFHFTEFLWLLLILLFMPVIILLILILFTYRQFVCFLINIKYGKNFGGLLDGADIVHALETPRGSKLGALFILKYKKNSSISFYETFKNAVYTTNLVRCPKTRAILKKSLGYFYYLKNKVTLSECVRKITVTNSGEKVVDKSTFMKFLHESEDIPLPSDNSGLWDVFIGTHPIQWTTEITDENVDFYPILFRFHHSLFDGYHLIKTIFDNFSDHEFSHEVTGLRVLPNEVVTRRNTLVTFRNTFSRIKSCIRHLYIIIIAPWRFFMMTKALAKDCNILCGKKLSDEKLFGFKIEEHPFYIDIIKTAKRQFPGASFTDIILTAISMALTKHFKKVMYHYVTTSFIRKYNFRIRH